MQAIERFLAPDEPVLWAARPHVASIARPLASAVAAVVLSAVAVAALRRADAGAAAYGEVAAALVALLVVLRAVRAVFRWDRTVLAVTPEQVVVLAGGVRLSAESVPLRTVSRLGVRQGPLQRILGYGTLLVGDGRARKGVHYVPRPAEVSRVIASVKVAAR
jgi:membrane protein YdbS with pleckstrin-like domain